MPSDEDFREALVWLSRMSTYPVSHDDVRGFFAWKRVKREHDDAFAALYEMKPRDRAALSTSLVLRRVRPGS